MTSELIKKLEKQGKLKKQETGAAQIEALIKQARKDLADAQKIQKVAEKAAYILAYAAMLKAGQALVMNLGYVPEEASRNNIIVEVTVDALGAKEKDLALHFETMHRRNNEITYETGAFISKSESEKAFEKAKLFIEAIVKEVKTKSPQTEQKPSRPEKRAALSLPKTENLKTLKQPARKLKAPPSPVSTGKKGLGYKAPLQLEYKAKSASQAKASFSPVMDTKAVQKIEALAREIWNEYFIPIIGEGQVRYMLEVFQSQKAIEDQIGKGYLYFLWKDAKGKEIGYFAVIPEKNGMFLSKFYVLKAFRGKGWGKAAMNFICDMAKERHLAKIFLTVNKNNIAAIETYKRYGFVITGQSVTDIGGDFTMDDYKMDKPL